MKILKREICFAPAYDKRDPDPKKNYGIHGVTMRWYLYTDRGVCQFIVYTGWHLPHVTEELARKGTLSLPMPADIGYHASVPQYEDHEPMENCHVMPAGKCYYDGSGLSADRFFRTLIEEGDEAVWKSMEQWFQHVYGNAEEVTYEWQ